MKTGMKVWLPLGIIILFLGWWAARQISFQEVWLTLRGLSWGQLAQLAALNLSIVLLFSSRWWIILKASGNHVPYLNLAGYRLAAFAVSYFTPGAQFGGEPLQIHLLSKRHRVPPAAALASVALDKLFELIANFSFLSLGFLLLITQRTSLMTSPTQGWLSGLNSSQAILWISLSIGLPFLYLFLLWRGWFPLAYLSRRLPAFILRRRPFHTLPALLASTERQISSIFRHSPGAIWASSLLSGLIWTLLIAEFWLMIHFLGVNLNLMQLITAFMAARLAFLTPLPGGAGALEAGQVFAMQALGFSPALGLSISVLIRARDIFLGLLGLWLGAVLIRMKPTASSEIEGQGHSSDLSGAYPLHSLKEVYGESET